MLRHLFHRQAFTVRNPRKRMQLQDIESRSVFHAERPAAHDPCEPERKIEDVLEGCGFHKLANQIIRVANNKPPIGLVKGWLR